MGQPLCRRPGWEKKLVMQSRDRVRSAEETACVDALRLQRSCEEWGECSHVAGKAGSLEDPEPCLQPERDGESQ